MSDHSAPGSAARMDAGESRARRPGPAQPSGKRLASPDRTKPGNRSCPPWPYPSAEARALLRLGAARIHFGGLPLAASRGVRTPAGKVCRTPAGAVEWPTRGSVGRARRHTACRPWLSCDTGNTAMAVQPRWSGESPRLKLATPRAIGPRVRHEARLPEQVVANPTSAPAPPPNKTWRVMAPPPRQRSGL
jgi:hypothetical protein